MAFNWVTKCEFWVPKRTEIFYIFGIIEVNKYFYMQSFRKKNIQKSTTDALDLETTISRIFENLARANSEFDNIQGSQLRQSHGLVTELKTKLEKLQDNEVDGLLIAFGSIYNQLVSKNHIYIFWKKQKKKKKHLLIKTVAKYEWSRLSDEFSAK